MTDRDVLAAIHRHLTRLDWDDTTLDGPRYQLANMRGYLESYFEQDDDRAPDRAVTFIDELGSRRLDEHLFAPYTRDWVQP